MKHVDTKIRARLRKAMREYGIPYAIASREQDCNAANVILGHPTPDTLETVKLSEQTHDQED